MTNLRYFRKKNKLNLAETDDNSRNYKFTFYFLRKVAWQRD